MKFDTETFYLKSDTDSGLLGLVLQNRQQHHTGTSGIGLLHDLFEHPYKPIANPYLDEIAALGAYNEHRIHNQPGDILRELKAVIYDLHEAYVDGTTRLKWNVKHVTELSYEIEELIENSIDADYYDYLVKYKYTLNHYFELGAKIFNNRFDRHFNSYYTLYHDIGDKVISKLNPLVNSELDNIKLTINYKTRKTTVEY